MSVKGRLERLGDALRLAYRRGVRPVHPVSHGDPPAIIVPASVQPATFEAACQRVRRAAQSLEMVSTLSMNPNDEKSLEAGIDVALRRLSGDVVK
jgi:hypothetical protein